MMQPAINLISCLSTHVNNSKACVIHMHAPDSIRLTQTTSKMHKCRQPPFGRRAMLPHNLQLQYATTLFVIKNGAI